MATRLLRAVGSRRLCNRGAIQIGPNFNELQNQKNTAIDAILRLPLRTLRLHQAHAVPHFRILGAAEPASVSMGKPSTGQTFWSW